MPKSEAQKESDRMSYAWLKSRGICVYCGKEYAEPNRVRCSDCAEKHRLENAKRYMGKPEKRDAYNQQRRERREKLKEAGICVHCGQKPAYTHNGHTYISCYDCYIKQKRAETKYAKKRYKRWRESGLCAWCGEACSDGYKLCPDCLEELKRRGLKGSPIGAAVAKEKRLKEGHPWVLDEAARWAGIIAQKSEVSVNGTEIR